MSRLTIDEHTTLLGAIADHEAEIASLKAKLYIDREEQVPSVGLTWLLWLYFLGWFAAAAFECVKMLAFWQGGIGSELTLAVAGGVWGATTSGWLSFNHRMANGWEFEDGTSAIDPGVKKERFNRRLAAGFFTRPLLGVLVGIVVLAGSHAGHFAAAGNPYAIAFLTIGGGLISKSLLETVKELGRKIFVDRTSA